MESGQSQTLGRSQDGRGTLRLHTIHTPKPKSPKQWKGHSAQQFAMFCHCIKGYMFTGSQILTIWSSHLLTNMKKVKVKWWVTKLDLVFMGPGASDKLRKHVGILKEGWVVNGPENLSKK